MKNDSIQNDLASIREQLEGKGDRVLDVLMMNMAEVLTTMVLAFTQMVPPETTMVKIRGVFMVTAITLLAMNREAVHLVGGRRTTLITEDPERSLTQDAKWISEVIIEQALLPTLEPRALTLHPDLSALGPEQGDDSLLQAIMNLDRGEEREGMRRKPPFPPVRERSPVRRDVPPSPRSGSSISSRSYSPDRSKTHPYQPLQGKNRDRAPGPLVSASRDGSPHSSVSASKEEIPVTEGPTDEPLPATEEVSTVSDEFHERRSQAIAAKAREIEKVYRQDCETFGMVVKMLVAKEPSLEKHLQTPLKENLSEIRERCLEDLRHFISELDEVVRQPESSA
uniref:Periphilin 1 n=1 Tax=Astyanax mexicanus TaxID=7994 RepID=A0A3B1IDT5_ASTMX